MSALPKTHVRGSMLPLLAMVVVLLATDLFAIYYFERAGLARLCALGFLQSQAGLFCILGGTLGRSWISSFLTAALLSVVSGFLLFSAQTYSSSATMEESAILFCGILPPVLFCGCIPFLLLRSLFGWHLSRRATELVEPYSLRIEDFLLAMTVIAALLAVANTVMGFATEIGGEELLPTLLMAALMASAASAVAVLPVSIFYFKSSTRRGRNWVLFLFAISGLLASDGFLIVGELWRGAELWFAIQRSWPTMLYLATSTVLFTLGLIVIHASGYRWRTIAKMRVPKETSELFEQSSTVRTAPGYRTPNRVAAAGIVLSTIAITVFVSHLKQERVRLAELFTKLNSTFVREGGYVEQEGHEAVSLRVPPDTDCSKLDLGQFRGLRTVSLAGTQITESVLRSIGRIDSLMDVDLSNTAIDDSNVSHLSRTRYLNKLSLAGTQLTVKGINEVITGCRTYRLDIGELKLDDRAISQLNLLNAKGLVLRGNPITDKSLMHLTSLQYLDLSHTKCTGSELGQLSQVHWLILDGTSVDDAAIQQLVASNLGMTRLSLRDTKVTDATLQCLAQYKILLELELGDGEITAGGLVAAALAPADRLALNSRKFNGSLFTSWKPYIRRLDMSHSGISDADLDHLKNIIALQELSLAHCDISDESLEKLVVLNLTKLDLSGTKVTATAVAKHFPKSTAVYLSSAQCNQEELSLPNPRGSLRIGLRFDER